MSQVSTSHELKTQSQQLLQGRLKHARTAALALALVPLAAVAATTQGQQDAGCPQSAGICGTVFYDTNGNGIQDSGEPGIGGVSVTISYPTPTGTVEFTVPTNTEGFYESGFTPSDVTYTVTVQTPNDLTASPANQGSNDEVDSDGVPDGNGNSVAHFFLPPTDNNGDATTDFGFTNSGFTNPGTGTPGYWKNHPEAWPSGVVIGGVPYTVDQAIAVMNTPVTKDKTYTMFASLVSAILNTQIGNDNTCVSAAIAAGQAWMTTYGPAGKGVAASSYAWKIGEPVHRLMDNYNNGMLCAPHRD
jgi:Tfp pilus assembly protein FimT